MIKEVLLDGSNNAIVANQVGPKRTRMITKSFKSLDTFLQYECVGQDRIEFVASVGGINRDDEKEVAQFVKTFNRRLNRFAKSFGGSVGEISPQVIDGYEISTKFVGSISR